MGVMFAKIGNQQRSLEERNVQRLSCDGSTLKSVEVEDTKRLTSLGDDIVYAYTKV